MATGSQGARDTREAASGAAHRAGEAASQVASSAQHAASQAASAVQNTASHLADQARDTASSVAEKARQAGNAAGQTAENLTSRLGSGMESAADSLREHSPSGVLGSAAGRVADTLESGGRYLQHEGLAGLGNDLTDMIKKNPIPALLLAVAVGVLIARATRS